ncbi:MAG: hypothetical protein QW511_03615 [Candidatus Methanomethylicia archaeon]
MSLSFNCYIGLPARSYENEKRYSFPTDLAITYIYPTGLTDPHHLRVSIPSNSRLLYIHGTPTGVYFYLDYIKGKVEQYDSSDQKIAESDIEVVRGSSTTILLASGSVKAKLFVSDYRIYVYNYGGQPIVSVYPDTIYNGVGDEFLRIAIEKEDNTELHYGSFISYRVCSDGALYTYRQVQSQNPILEIPINVSNTDDYADRFLLTIDEIVGSSSMEDTLTMDIVDQNGGYLDSVVVSLNITPPFRTYIVYDKETWDLLGLYPVKVVLTLTTTKVLSVKGTVGLVYKLIP